jgi:NTP pyrophosphatase (non-canonical NTP hydrolase)
MMYHVYHIHGKKVGVTRDLKERVENQQGYGPEEYTVVYSTDEISVASIMERELQEAYGYKVDETLYENLSINQEKNEEMNINVTEQTTTFACPVNKLKGQLMDDIGMQWNTSHGTFTITGHSINWIMANALTSQYNDERCFIYNKAFARYWDTDPNRNIIQGPTHSATMDCNTNLDRINKKLFSSQDELVDYHADKLDCDTTVTKFDLIRDWADERGIYAKGDVKTQYVKLTEELGETGKAILNQDTPEIIDGIGDMVVVLTNLAHLAGTTIEHCIDQAYKEISERKGKMVNGTFVKQSK